VLPIECGSWEENPPSILAFTQRDLRWCQGNMQYWRLLTLPGLKFMSRFQLAWAILMFLGVPAFTLMVALMPLKVIDGKAPGTFPVGLAIGLYLVFQAMCLTPKIAGLLDILFTPGGLARYGGARRFSISALVELTFSYLLGAVTTLRTSAFMVGLLFGRTVKWSGQARDVAMLSWTVVMRRLWWHGLFGIAVATALALTNPMVLLWSSPLIAGYLIAVPFAVLTAAPKVGALYVRAGLSGIPEDFDPPDEIKRLRSLSMSTDA
jgi:membrane glycosyltransferase